MSIPDATLIVFEGQFSASIPLTFLPEFWWKGTSWPWSSISIAEIFIVVRPAYFTFAPMALPSVVSMEIPWKARCVVTLAFEGKVGNILLVIECFHFSFCGRTEELDASCPILDHHSDVFSETVRSEREQFAITRLCRGGYNRASKDAFIGVRRTSYSL